MSADERPVPATVSLSRNLHSEIGALAGALADVWDGMRLIASAVGVELPETESVEWARRRAGAESRQASVDRLLGEMAESRSAARRQSAVPSYDLRRDGSRIRHPEAGWEAMERANFIGRNPNSQAARHAAMAKGSAPYDVADAHAATRKDRERIYEAALKKDGQR